MFTTLLSKELLEHYRTRRIAIVSLVLLFMALSSALLAKLMPELLKNFNTPGITVTITETTPLDAVDQFVKNISQLGIFILLFVVSGAVAEERTRKTLELLLVKPVTRSMVIASKFTAYLGVVAVGLLLSCVVFAAYSYTLFGWFPFQHFIGVAVLLTGYVLSTLAVTIAASSIARSALAATGIGFAWVIISSTVSSLMPSIGRYLPSAVFSAYRDLIVGGWQTIYWYPVATSLLLIAGCIFVSIKSFSRQEIER